MFAHVLVSIVGFVSYFVFLVSLFYLFLFSCRLCVSLSVVVFSLLSGSCLVVRVPWFLGSVLLCLALAPYVVYLFVCIFVL